MMVRKTGSLAAEFLTCEDVTLRTGEGSIFAHTDWIMRRNEQWAIIGPNGSGKSLWARALAGQVPLVSGEIRYSFESAASAERPDHRANAPEQAVAVVSPQAHREILLRESSFYQSRWHSSLGEGDLTVTRLLAQENVEGINPYEVNPRLGSRVHYRQLRTRYVHWLGVEHLLRRKLIHLSNGEMRKVLLVEALLRQPRLLILDDPYAGLDFATRRRLKNVIEQLLRTKLKVLVITHRLDEIPVQTTHLMLIDRYRILAQGPKLELIDHPVARLIQPNHASSKPRPKTDHSEHPLRRRTLDRPAKGTRPAAKLNALIVMNNVTVKYGGKTILHQINWTMRAGEHWAVLGPNGSGKSTLLSLIQVDNPQVYAQDIQILGATPDSTQALWQARQRLSWISPELHLYYPGEWSCLEVVCSGFNDSIGLYQSCSARQRQTARRFLRALGLKPLAARPFGELSTGEQRLTLLARAMVKKPALFILDEPCQGLDGIHRRLIIDAIDQLVKTTSVSVVFVTHHADETPACITHIMHLHEGAIRRAGRR